MRSFAPTLLTAFGLLFFSTATSAFEYRKFPYAIECDGNRRDITRNELQDAGRDSIKGSKIKKPYYYKANNFENAGNCKDLSLPLYKLDLEVNGLAVYFVYDEAEDAIWYCNFELDDKYKGDYKCKNNYSRHTYGADEPPKYDDDTAEEEDGN